MANEDERAGWPTVPGYELHEVLGRGGFATVYRATQTSVERAVALKVLAAGSLDPNRERRFRHEVRAVGALSDHPHVVTLFDAGVTPAGAPFISMQLVPDGSFGDRLRRDGALPPADVARIGAEVADALEAAHDAGILHRDIKPDNVLVGRRGGALLTDFGIATLDGGTMTATGTITGTIAYTPPEVITGSRPTTAADVYSLGATLYSLASGRLAFTTGEEHVATVIYRITTEDAPPLPPEVPFPLVDLIGSCMAKEPGERPSLAEVATLLEGIAAQNPAPAISTAVDDDEPPTIDVPSALDLTDGPADDATISVAPRSPDADAATAVATPAAVAPDTAHAGPPPPTAPTVVAPSAPSRPPATPHRARSGSGFPTRKLVVVAVLIALSMVAAVVLTVVLGVRDDGDGSSAGGEPLVVDVGANPVALAPSGDGSVWVANRDDGTVTHLGPDGEDLGTTPTGAGPSSLAATAANIWVVNTDDSTLTMLTPSGDAVATNGVGDGSSAVVATDDSVWVASPDDDDIARIDAETGQYDTEAPTDVDYEAAHLAVGDGTVWAALTLADSSGLLVAVDPDSFSIVARITLDAAPSGVAVTDEAVWVALGQGAAVVRVDPDPAGAGILGTAPFEGRELGEVVVAPDGTVWVADLTTGEGSVVRMDDDGAEAEVVDVGERTRAFTITDDAFWVPVSGGGTVRRVPR